VCVHVGVVCVFVGVLIESLMCEVRGCGCRLACVCVCMCGVWLCMFRVCERVVVGVGLRVHVRECV